MLEPLQKGLKMHSTVLVWRFGKKRQTASQHDVLQKCHFYRFTL